MRWRLPSPPLRLSLFLGFFGLTLITALLGIYSLRTIRATAALVVETYDRSLMAINYARAADADFARLKSALMQHRLVTDAGQRDSLATRIAQIRQDLDDDLSIAAERAQSARAAAAVDKVRASVDGWEANWAEHQIDANWAALDRFGSAAEHELDLLVNYTAEDGFSFRQAALAAIQTDTQLDLLLTGGGVLAALLLSWALGQRILGPVSLASAIAERIAGGELDVAIPAAGRDELGRLLGSMAAMRDSIAGMMAREVAQRRSAQARLTDAIENSREGVILVNGAGEVVVSNSQALEFFEDLAPMLRPGAFFPDFVAELGDRARQPGRDEAGPPVSLLAGGGGLCSAQVQLRDGRTIRIGWSSTGEGGLVAFCSDMTEWKLREAELKQSNLWLDAALENMSQGLCMYDAEGRLMVANRRFCEIFALERGRLRIGMPMRELIELKLSGRLPEGMTAERVWAERQGKLRQRHTFAVQVTLAGGRIVEVFHQPMTDGGWVATYEDVTERHRAREKILFMARHDALTGLPNRLLFGERLEAAMAEADPTRPFALLCIDLDHFKTVNDTLGHPVGDRLLRGVAERFTGCARADDTIARLGGDEFATLLTGLRHPSDAMAYAERLIGVIRPPFLIDGHELAVGASIGIAIAPAHGTDRDTLMRNADIALYRAKAAGRSGWQVFEPAMEAEVQAKRRIEIDLGHALAGGQLEIHYQPVFDAATLGLTGFEALLRWRHPTRGLIGAGEFVGVAEDTASIHAIGLWVLREACRVARGWPAGLRLAINVSPVQLRASGFFAEFAAAIAAEGIAPGRLELEVTETVLLQRDPVTLGTLQRIKANGIAVALDDFGTGYSSLAYLQTFSFDRLKIDQSFVRGLPESEDAAAIVRAIVGLGAALGIPITAEGVEDAAQLEALRHAGCGEVQGFLLGRPVPAAEVASVIARAAGAARVVKRRPLQPIAAR